MACTEEKREINGKVYYCRQWDATKALENQMKLLQVFKGSAIPFVDGDFTFGNVLNMFQSGDVEKTLPLIKDFVCRARVDGQEITSATFDFEYSGDMLRIIQVFSFVCEVQYKYFFEAGLAMSGANSATQASTTPES